MKIESQEQVGELKTGRAISIPYAVFLLFTAVILLIAAAYLGSESLQSFGIIAFWLSIAGRCFSWLMDWSESKK